MLDQVQAAAIATESHDPLTGLVTRERFLAVLERITVEARGTGTRLAVIKVDIQRMLALNETYGCDVGDVVMRTIADRLREFIDEGYLVARTHGAGFLVLVPGGEGRQNPCEAVDRIQAAFELPVEIDDDTSIFVQGNAGVAIFPDDCTDAQGMLRAANVALQQARRDPGTGHAFYRSEHSITLVSHERLQQALYQALERDEFVPYYQPQFSLTDGALIGFEALIRWYRQEGEIVMPGQFIPLAERTGLIVELGEAMLEAVMNDMAKWRKGGLPVPPVAVNISPHHLRHDGFAERLLIALSKSGLPPSLLFLELTETAFVGEFRRTREIMEHLARAGVRFSIDDFGTGFSSLRYLALLPLHVLKVDRSFVGQIDSDYRQRCIVEALAKMGKSLGLTVIAEGVETAPQIGWLRDIGCHGIQGFLYGHPAPAEAAIQWIAASR